MPYEFTLNLELQSNTIVLTSGFLTLFDHSPWLWMELFRKGKSKAGGWGETGSLNEPPGDSIVGDPPSSDNIGRPLALY